MIEGRCINGIERFGYTVLIFDKGLFRTTKTLDERTKKWPFCRAFCILLRRFLKLKFSYEITSRFANKSLLKYRKDVFISKLNAVFHNRAFFWSFVKLFTPRYSSQCRVGFKVRLISIRSKKVLVNKRFRKYPSNPTFLSYLN